MGTRRKKTSQNASEEEESPPVPKSLGLFPRIKDSRLQEDYIIFFENSKQALLYNFALTNSLELITIGRPPSKPTMKQLKIARRFSINRVGYCLTHKRMNLIDFMNSDYNTQYIFVQPPTVSTDVPASTTDPSSSQHKLPASTTSSASQLTLTPSTTASVTSTSSAKPSQKVKVKIEKSDYTNKAFRRTQDTVLVFQEYGDTKVRPTPKYAKKYIVTDEFTTHNNDNNVIADRTYWVSLDNTTIEAFLKNDITNNKKKMKNNEIMHCLSELARLCTRKDITFQNPKDVECYLVNISQSFQDINVVRKLHGLCEGIYNLSIMYREEIPIPRVIRSNNNTNNRKYDNPRWWDSKFSESESKLREGIEKYYNFSYEVQVTQSYTLRYASGNTHKINDDFNTHIYPNYLMI